MNHLRHGEVEARGSSSHDNGVGPTGLLSTCPKVNSLELVRVTFRVRA